MLRVLTAAEGGKGSTDGADDSMVVVAVPMEGGPVTKCGTKGTDSPAANPSLNPPGSNNDTTMNHQGDKRRHRRGEEPWFGGGACYTNDDTTRAVRTVRVFRQKFTLEDAIGSHACSLKALPCV
jgi:hypothetical protein